MGIVVGDVKLKESLDDDDGAARTKSRPWPNKERGSLGSSPSRSAALPCTTLYTYNSIDLAR